MPHDAKGGKGRRIMPLSRSLGFRWRGKQKINLAGWVARTRPLAEPLSPRGPQPVLKRLRTYIEGLNGSPEPPGGVPGL
jgi:hypothetical protein